MSFIKLHGISDKELLSVRTAFEKSAGERATHRELGHYMAGTYAGYYYPVFIENRKFIVAPSRIFEVILRDVLPHANQRYPDKFGTYNAYGIMEAMYDIEPTGWDLDGFIGGYKRIFFISN